MKKILTLFLCTVMTFSLACPGIMLVSAEENEILSVSEAAVLAAGSTVRVEGLVVGVAHEGYKNDTEMLIKDINSDTLTAVRNIPYGAFPDFGYKKGDRIVFDATVKADTSTSTSYSSKNYLDFSDDNGEITSTIISQNNELSYNFDNAVTISSWEDMQSAFDSDTLKPYTYLKITDSSYLHYYESTSESTSNYRLHKNAEATEAANIKPDGSRSVAIRDDVMTQNIGSDWNELFFDELVEGYPGTPTDKTFYAVYIGGNKTYYQLVILDESWIGVPKYENSDIIKEVAYAYYRQGGQILYDQASATARRHLYASPEDATKQKTLYLDCSSFVNSCYRESFGVNVLPVSIAEASPNTSNYNEYAKNNPSKADVVGYWENADYTTDEEKQAVISSARSLLAVGDLLNYRHCDASGNYKGHVYIYVGNDTFLHCYGGGSYTVNSNNPALSYDSNASEVTNGQIATISASSIFTDTTHKRYIFKETTSDTVTSFCILRPLARELTPTAEALGRMEIAGLSMEKTSSVPGNSSVHIGDTLTYTVTLENTNSQAISGITITDTLSDGTEFISGSDGVNVSGQKLTWSGSVDGNSTVTVTYDVTISATTPGTEIISDSTYVNGVKLGNITHTVSCYTKTHENMLTEIAKKYINTSTSFDDSLSLVKSIYTSALGISIFGDKTVDDILNQIIDTENLTCQTSTELAKMLVPNLYGGLDIKDGTRILSEHERTRLISEDELAIGDIILAEWSGGNVVYIYLGNSTLATIEDGACKMLTIGSNIYGKDADNILISLFAYDRFAVLRPSMMNTAPMLNVEAITVTSLPSKCTYYNYESFNPDGMVISATLNNGTTWELTDFSVSPQTLIYPQSQVTVTFGNLSAVINVTVSENMKTISVEEASLLDSESIVRVEGLVVGVAHEGYKNDTEMLIKDINSDILTAVRNIPYGAFPDFGYKKGDRIVFNATVKADTSTSTSYSSKNYLDFSDDNGEISSTIISQNNEILYNFDNAVTISSWEDMQSVFDSGTLKPYTYLKITDASYLYYYAGTDTDNYVLHKNADATEVLNIKPDGNRSIAIRNDVMTQNIGSDWTGLFFDELVEGYPGTPTDKTFYAVYIGGNKTYYQLVILDEDWIINDSFSIVKFSEAANTAHLNIPTLGTYIVAFADYENNVLKNVELKTVTATDIGRSTVQRKKDFSLGSGDKIMLLSDILNIKPLCNPLIIE